jgi:hypothetical protein
MPRKGRKDSCQEFRDAFSLAKVLGNLDNRKRFQSNVSVRDVEPVELRDAADPEETGIAWDLIFEQAILADLRNADSNDNASVSSKHPFTRLI